MARSLDSAARSLGLGSDDRRLLGRACALAMGPRVATLGDDHHPAYLHPGRSVLVILRDVGALPAGALAAAALRETEDTALRVPEGAIRSALPGDVLDAVRAMPSPGDPELLERLVGLPEAVAVASLAERLDHLRHLHLRDDLRDLRAERHAEAEAVWLPFAERVHPGLAVRFAHWARTFARRL